MPARVQVLPGGAVLALYNDPGAVGVSMGLLQPGHSAIQPLNTGGWVGGWAGGWEGGLISCHAALSASEW
jgi:hypothetical protein